MEGLAIVKGTDATESARGFSRAESFYARPVDFHTRSYEQRVLADD